MSEAEIKRRLDYKRNRKKWLMIQIIAIAVIAVMALGSFLIYDRMNRTYYIEYTEQGNVDYKVQYKDNGFFDEEWQKSDQEYISTLINGIVADFEYKLNMNAEQVGFDYSYGITADLIIADKTSGNALFSPSYELLPKKTESVSSGNKLKISESVAIDYNKYNELANEFVKVYGLKNVTSTLVVTMNVNVISQCDEFEENNENAYSTSLNIPLTKDTLSIVMTSSVPEEESKVLACSGAVDQNIFLTVGIVFASLALLLICVMLAFMYLTRNEDVNYTIKVQKLVSAYRSFIQQIEGEFDTEGYQTVMIKTFNEMLGIRDTIQSPILMSENRDQTMTQFLIPTNTKLLYVFEIKVENYDEIYGIGKEESEDTLVLETEDYGIEEAIIIEKGVDAEAVAEAMAEPDVILDEVDYVKDDDEDFEGTVEEPGVEVIGVVWPERAHRNKVYRYDPNGEELADGDMVLVPTRDAARDKEVIRKAAVAHGNHKIDPELLTHPLKKIIGVIKRRAEAALTHDSEEK